MNWKIEVVTIPVSDVDRARDFYAEKVGFAVDMEPGSIDGVFLVVRDVRVARDQLVERGVEVGELQVFDDGSYRPAREGEGLDYVGCVFFSDPDGNRWCVQQIPARN